VPPGLPRVEGEPGTSWLRCRAGKCPADSPCFSSAADAATDTRADADACVPSGCTGSCVGGAHNVSHLVDGCLVWQCCVLDDAGSD
jgi:hypothetical protein